jgi:homoserine dehydrogenase
MSITEKLLFISAFIYVYKAWTDGPISLNLGVVFAIISDQIMTDFKKIVVIGAGTMGSGIAAHLANSQRQVVLLDLKGGEQANEIALRAIDNIKKSDPPLLVEKERLGFIIPGNLTDDFDQIADADWIIEAVVERIDIKHNLYKQIHRRFPCRFCVRRCLRA